MNVIESDILKSLMNKPFVNQRVLSEATGYSLGKVNETLKELNAEGYLNNLNQLTDKAESLIAKTSPKNAIILAAGSGMRMVPVNLSFPKALLEVNGERLIERLIRQLNEAGINDITVVVGFMKESFEYLIDKYGVKLTVNRDYFRKNNLHTLNLVRNNINNTYIVPCDIWCAENPFSKVELHSWYMLSNQTSPESNVRVNRKNEIVIDHKSVKGNGMVGIAYLIEPESEVVKENLKLMDETHPNDFWESALVNNDKLILAAKMIDSNEYVEINTYEQLRNTDSKSSQLKSDAIRTITEVFGSNENEITNLETLKKGMTNRSFVFTVKGSKYVMRIPGEGTDKLIDRKQEAEVYSVISGLDLSNEPIYINPDNGYKITDFLDSIRVCDPASESDIARCMKRLREFHDLKLSVNHSFDIFGHIEFYESLREGKPSVYGDYNETKANVYKLRSFVDSIEKDWCLTHIDAVPDNFLFFSRKETDSKVLLIDWEYSGMQDPHVDIAMFCIYSLYGKQECDHLIDLYFEGNCDVETRAKIYCYIAMCGLLWSNWCEYKQMLGVEFGEYSLRQYRYAKEYFRYAKELIGGKYGIE
ncbi:MAG: NTP transferase domain-containing protein [Eubacteriales bacterium]|nr:NTP transferase domain-containing protein [Eubacteriales bacterium]